jgi:hypothetical protein
MWFSFVFAHPHKPANYPHYPLTGFSDSSSEYRNMNMKRIITWLYSDNVLVRLFTLWLICALLFIISWIISYYLLPEGILRGKLLAGKLPVETDRIITTFLRIFSFNLFVAAGLIVFANLFRVGQTPLGYLIVSSHSIIYGILLGTNSFGIPAPIRFAPSLSILLSRSGIFEISAYIAIAAATTGLVIMRQPSWLSFRSEVVASPRNWHLNRKECIVIILAVILLALGNFREAVQIHHLSTGYPFAGGYCSALVGGMRHA